MLLNRLFGVSAALACTLAVAPVVAQQGQLGGRVTDERTSDGVAGARVLLVGSTRIEQTGQDGSYLFRGMSPGDHQVRVLAIGFSAQARTATVIAGETATLDFTMTPVPVRLDEIVTTATGQQSKLEIGNAISSIDASKVAEEAPITEFGDVLSGRAAGVQVLKSSGATGTGTKIRIRGSNSVSLSNEPLYYIDGIRVDATPDGYAYDIGGQSTSRINDLNPDDIQNIEIVKGPSAATLYGIQAANGVVLITTRRGVAGKPKWNGFVEQGFVDDHNTYRTNYFGRSDDPNFDPFCTLLNVADGDCVQSRVDAVNPLNDPQQRPLAPGHRQQYGLNVAGGSEATTYYLSADYEGEVGVYKLRGFDFDSVRQANSGTVPGEQLRPNKLGKLTLRANGTAKVASNADLQLSLGYLTSQLHLVENDNTLNSIIGSGDGSGDPLDVNRGWYLVPAEVFAEQEPAGHRQVYRRSHRELAAARVARHQGDVRVRRDQPAGHPVLAHRRNQRHRIPGSRISARSTSPARKRRRSRSICSRQRRTSCRRRGAAGRAWEASSSVPSRPAALPRGAVFRAARSRSSAPPRPMPPTTTSRAAPPAASSISR